MDQLCKFLSVDLCDLLLGLFHCPESEESTAAELDVVDGFSYVIKHKYPQRLITYDAEEIGEPRLIRFSDLTESVVQLIMPHCTKSETQVAEQCQENEDECQENEEDCQENEEDCQENDDECPEIEEDCQGNEENCQDIKVDCKPVKVERNLSNTKHNDKCKVNDNKEQDKEKDNRIVCNFLKSLFPGEELSDERLKQLEKCSKILHKRFIQCQTEAGQEVSTTPMKWESLKPLQKFCFYWQALTGHVLHSTPYENFKDIFLRRYRRKCPGDSMSQLRGVVRRCWRCLKSEERVPFNLNALLYHVSTGQVDPFDHCAVRMLLNRWR